MAVLIRSEPRPKLLTRTCRRTTLIRRVRGLCLNGSQREFKSILDSTARTISQAFHYLSPGLSGPAHLSGLRESLSELRECAAILGRITGSSGVSFEAAVSAFTGGTVSGLGRQLRVALNELKDHEDTLDRFIAKRRILDALPSWPT